jgi:predicted nucleic acid-binding protein
VSLYFLDSSALVKRYVAETGSTWIQTITATQANNQLIITRITWVEVLSALARRQREGGLSSINVDKAVQAFRYDLDMQYQIVELDRSLAETAGQLVRKHVLRAYDAVQLAAALRVQSALPTTKASALTFVTADTRLITAAQAEKASTDNPNNYP